ncbi:hypothetical protein AV530_013130 [Patagioenas fasciata monilis]|uniref:Uncharacterized protein n=1 Tax=Patagioenas fasciata monilis TaxID=372326 RepID=A0A1V4JA91_PATFA|nr:hypothetical protein AV530_013130 [Patagioenas fasciata monilis]
MDSSSRWGQARQSMSTVLYSCTLKSQVAVTPDSVASDSIAFQIRAVTLCLLLFLMREWSRAILAQQVVKKLNHQMDWLNTSHAALF